MTSLIRASLVVSTTSRPIGARKSRTGPIWAQV